MKLVSEVQSQHLIMQSVCWTGFKASKGEVDLFKISMLRKEMET